jgi:sec-independent protein translocase protein TatA
MLGFHWPELIIVFGLILLIFGPKKLPEIGSSLGKSITAFRSGLHEQKLELKEGLPSSTPELTPEKMSEM